MRGSSISLALGHYVLLVVIFYLFQLVLEKARRREKCAHCVALIFNS